ncbi:MAG: fumarate/nitrate reduction transcriptional regulator Fnr [Burkholderiales bacterium]|nr:fumarate/nitrate reduction transcriptional regulator Fnr [Sulfuricellaceae bacterium]
MTAMVRKMPIGLMDVATPTSEICSISCSVCGIYALCREANGPDVDPRLQESIVKNRRLLKRGEFLYRIGDPLRAIYAIRSGSIKTCVRTNDGRVQITSFHISGDVLGLGAFATHHYASEAQVMETTMVCEVPVDVLEAYGNENPSIRQQMVKILSQEILDNQELLLLLGKKNAEERLATFLLSLSRRLLKRSYSPLEFNLSMSRSDIGSYLGMAEETVCRVLARFEEEGLIVLTRRHVQLLNPDRLMVLAGDESAVKSKEVPGAAFGNACAGLKT